MADNPNMRIYDAVRSVPPEAIKPITAGRLKGKSDINPMWRIKKLTELYGPCGEGWYTDDVRYWTVTQEKSMEMAVFCDLNLFTRGDNGWSKPIYGTGGNTVIAAERNGLYLDDDAYKKAYTDALSVACKALGIGADVYWQSDRTKYSGVTETEQTAGKNTKQAKPVQVTYDHKASVASYMATRGINQESFMSLRKACIDGGLVPDKPSAEMAPKDWQTLFGAIDEAIGYTAS